MSCEKYKAIYTECWNLHKKYYGKKDLTGLPEDMREIHSKYQCIFCNDLLIAVAEELNRDTGDKG